MEYFSTIKELFITFNWHSPSWDLFILLFWLAGSVIYAFSAGRGRILTILISVYMSQLIVKETPFLTDAISHKLDINLLTLQQLAAFSIIFIVLFIFLSRYAFSISADGRQLSATIFGVAFSILQVGLLINIVLNYLPDHVKNTFSDLVQMIFLHHNSNFIWLILPVAFLVVLGRFISDNNSN